MVATQRGPSTDASWLRQAGRPWTIVAGRLHSPALGVCSPCLPCNSAAVYPAPHNPQDPPPNHCCCRRVQGVEPEQLMALSYRQFQMERALPALEARVARLEVRACPPNARAVPSAAPAARVPAVGMSPPASHTTSSGWFFSLPPPCPLAQLHSCSLRPSSLAPAG